MLREEFPSSTLNDTWPSELEVADQVPIAASLADAQRVLREVPLWFHTFSLNTEHALYTPGKARDHGYRLASIPESFEGLSALDVGSFDGFYAFLSEARGAGRVLAVDNEQYIEWVRGRWGVELRGAEGFEAIRELLGSQVQYRRMDAFELDRLEEQFDFIFCFGILHRVENPIGLLQRLRRRLSPGGTILVETYGVRNDDGADNGVVLIPSSDGVYAGDEYVYWQFSSSGLERLAALAGLGEFELHDTPIVDDHPRIIGRITTAA